MSVYYNSLPAEVQRNYVEKLRQIGITKLECDPFIECDVWVDNVTKWPDVEFGQIYCYLIDSPGEFTRESLNAYRSLEAYNYFHSGWVHTCMYKDIEESGKCLLKAKVNRSQALSEKPHEAWVCVEKADSTVKAAHCTCMAGLGEVCSHVAAVLFKVEACVRLGFNKVACTSMPCQWNQNFTRKVEAVPLSNIIFTKPKHSNYHEIKRTTCVQKKPVFDDTTSFLARLKMASPEAVIFSVTEPKPNPPVPKPSLPMLLTSLYCENYANLTNSDLDEKCNDIFQSLNVTAAEASTLEACTRQQSTSLKWHEYRKGRVTASYFYDVCHTNETNPSPSLLKKIMQYTPNVETPAIRWGKKHEVTALKHYESTMKGHHTSFKVSGSGMVINPSYPYLGASPDGVTNCECCGDGLVEIKCPYKYTAMDPCSISSSSFYLNEHDAVGTGSDTCMCKQSLKNNSKYYYQVQGQLAVCNASHCDFVCWTPKGTHIERIYRDNSFFSGAKEKLKNFFLKSILPEILTKRSVQRNLCFCGNGEDFDDMIACDSGKCKAEWYHYQCVGLVSVPKGTWICLPCKNGSVSKRKKLK